MGIGARTKGYLKDMHKGDIMKFIYNPETFNTTRGASYLEVSSPGSSYPVYQYTSATKEEITLTLYLRDTKGGETAKYITFLESLLPPKDSTSKFTKPSRIMYAFGDKVEKCVLLDLSIDYLDFDEDLTVKEANANLKMVVIC